MFMDRLIERRQATGKGFSRYNPENPSKPFAVPSTEQPTMSDLMSTMRVDKATQGRLANALYQMALAEGVDINQEGKQRYASRKGSYQPVYRPEGNSSSVNLDLRKEGIHAVDLPRQNITFDSPAGFFYDGVDAAYIPNSQRANIDGKSVYLQAALRNLKNPDGSPVDADSKSPFIGVVAGEKPGTLRYRKGFKPGVSIEEGYTDLEKSMVKGRRKYSQKRVDGNIALAREVEARFKAGEENKAVRRVMREADRNQWRQNQDFADVEENINIEKNRSYLLDALATGKSLPGKGSGDDGFRVAETPIRQKSPKPRKSGMITPNPSDPLISMMAGGKRKQPIQEAPVAPSIAPDPGVSTGNQIAPMADAGNGYGPSPVTPRQENNVRSFGSSQNISEDINRIRATRQRSGATPRGPLMDTSGAGRNRQQMADAVLNEMTKATGYNVRNASRDLKNIATNPKYQRGRRIGYGVGGGTAALATILGLSDNKEEQEQYQ